MGGAPSIVWLRDGVGYTPAAAASMWRLERALGRPHDCNSSYRDYNEQLSMWRAWQWYLAGGPYPGHSRALHPDASMHCQGLADDSDDWRTPGYIELAAEFGWVRTAAGDPTEQHHFEYQSWRDNHLYEPANVGASPFEGAKPAPVIEEEDDMPGIRIHHQVFTNGNQAYVVENASWFFVPEDAHLAALAKAYDIDLAKLPHLNEYDWNAVEVAKARSNSSFDAMVAQVDALAKAVAALPKA